MTPEPVPAVVEVKAAGSPPLQMVCAVAITPAVTAFCTVIVAEPVLSEEIDEQLASKSADTV
jgi:hypothetical protein